MAEVVAVCFRLAPKPYYFDPGDLRLRLGDRVVAETAKGIELGRVTEGRHSVPDELIPQPLKQLLRVATPGDLRKEESNRAKETEARQACVALIQQHGLPMRLVNVAYTLDRSRVVFYFSAEGRVDFRDLVRDLARSLRTRIELHQVGVRDQAKMVGGFGTCGRPLCCATFLHEFCPVAIRMAKEQGLSLNPTKISGMCGRLLCCLRYEYDTYRELRRTLPKPGATVETVDGPGVVVDVELLRETFDVELHSAESDGAPEGNGEVRSYRLSDLVEPEPVPKKRPRKDRRKRRRGRKPKDAGAAEGSPAQGTQT